MKNKKLLFKGDQNIFWDSFIYNVAINKKIPQICSNVIFTPFIHDEKFGVSDQNISHFISSQKNDYILTEDYSDSAGDACYINIDASVGILYLPAIELHRLEEFNINIKSLANEYVKYHSFLDANFTQFMSKEGLLLDLNTDINDGFGKTCNIKELENLFTINPKQRLYYCFTKSRGRYGIVPINNNDYIMSSINLNEDNLNDTISILIQNYLSLGVMNQLISEKQKTAAQKRINNLHNYINKLPENISITDFEINISDYLLSETNNRNCFKLSKSSYILSNKMEYNISDYFLLIAKSNTDIFIEAYNRSLNETKLNIQRLNDINKYNNIPFYGFILEQDNRYRRSNIFLDSQSNEFLYRDLYNNKYRHIDDDTIVSGKALMFLNELRLYPNIMALPEYGSKYSVAADVFIKHLRENMIQVPQCSTMRFSVNFLDNLKLLKEEYIISLPKIFYPFFGSRISCYDLSDKWRAVVDEIYMLLIKLNEYKWGKELKEAKYIININKFITKESISILNTTLNELEEMMLVARKDKKMISKEFRNKMNLLRFKIKLIVNYYKQNLLQMYDGLIYLNERPYSIAIYLMFGSEFINTLIENVTYSFENV